VQRTWETQLRLRPRSPMKTAREKKTKLGGECLTRRQGRGTAMSDGPSAHDVFLAREGSVGLWMGRFREGKQTSDPYIMNRPLRSYREAAHSHASIRLDSREENRAGQYQPERRLQSECHGKVSDTHIRELTHCVKHRQLKRNKLTARKLKQKWSQCWQRVGEGAHSIVGQHVA